MIPRTVNGFVVEVLLLLGTYQLCAIGLEHYLERKRQERRRRH